MADWNIPVNTSMYSEVLGFIKAVSADAGTLFLANPTNQPTGSMRWSRSLNQFEEWTAGAWQPKVLSVAGGGTGSNTAAGSRTNLGLGTMAVQNANAVAISGGSLTNVTMGGNVSFSGGGFSISSTTTTALSVQGVAHAYSLHVQGAAGYASHGAIIRGGTGNAGEMALIVQNAAASASGLVVNGAMTVAIGVRLIIPVGANFWA